MTMEVIPIAISISMFTIGVDVAPVAKGDYLEEKGIHGVPHGLSKVVAVAPRANHSTSSRNGNADSNISGARVLPPSC